MIVGHGPDPVTQSALGLRGSAPMLEPFSGIVSGARPRRAGCQPRMPSFTRGEARSQAQDGLRVRGVRPRLAQVARPVPGVPAVEHAARGGRGRGERRARALPRLRRRLARHAPRAAARGHRQRGGAAAHRHRRARPRARRRRRAGLARPARRRPRDREEHAHAGHAGAPRPRDAEQLAPAVVAVDSIQTQYLPELLSAPGTVTQIREVTARLMAYAKTTETPTFLVGHVTKDGAIAGPRVLEHMVDTVLYFEGGGAHPYRVLRAHKNRFGSASEIGVFEMKAGGLAEVANPSALFLAERPEDAPGSAVAAVLNGTRTVLVEVQALVAPTGFGTPRRTALGIDSNRVALLAAVLEKKVGMEILSCDIFVNVAGGLSVDDPA